MIDKVPAKIRRGNDMAKFAVATLRAVSEGWIPPEKLTFQEYIEIKENPQNFAPELVGFAAHCCTFGGKLWGGYARNNRREGDNSTVPGQQSRSLVLQGKKMRGVKFTSIDYRDMIIPSGSTVYCDPPYEGTTGYKIKFCHDTFWNWAEKVSNGGSRVFVSEYQAPENWKCVWEKGAASSLDMDRGSKSAIERLFTIPSVSA